MSIKKPRLDSESPWGRYVVGVHPRDVFPSGDSYAVVEAARKSPPSGAPDNPNAPIRYRTDPGFSFVGRWVKKNQELKVFKGLEKDAADGFENVSLRIECGEENRNYRHGMSDDQYPRPRFRIIPVESIRGVSIRPHSIEGLDTTSAAQQQSCLEKQQAELPTN